LSAGIGARRVLSFPPHRQFLVGHLLHGIAQQHGVGIESHVTADLAADQVVVAGQNLYCHTMLVQRFDGGGCGSLGRVEKGHIPLQNQTTLILL